MRQDDTMMGWIDEADWTTQKVERDTMRVEEWHNEMTHGVDDVKWGHDEITQGKVEMI